MTQKEQIAALAAQVAALTAVLNGMSNTNTTAKATKTKAQEEDTLVHVIDYYKPMKKVNSRGKKVPTGEFAKESKCILIYGNTKPIKDKILSTFGANVGFGQYYIQGTNGKPQAVKGWLLKNTDKQYKTADIRKQFAASK